MNSGFQKVLVILLAVVIITASCNSDDEFDPGIAPEIPPIATMVMDVDNFTEGTTSQAFMEGRVMSKLNWSVAAIQVGFWNTILALNMAVPVAAFTASINETPVFDRDQGLWIWTFDYNFVGRTYTSRLTAQVIANEVEWNMYISEESGFQDVLWYTGTMQLNGTSGYWLLSKNGNNPTEYLRIDWEKESEEVGSIRYEVVEAGVPEIDSYIEYGRMAEGDYNVYYNIVITSTQKSAEIEWNDETGAGRVEYDASGVFYCWDTNFDDVDCE